MQTQAKRSRFNSALFFASANIAASFLNYLFQLVAARGLSVIDFGEFTKWVAFLSVGLVAGSITQFAANFLQLENRRLIQLVAASIGINLLGAFIVFSQGADASHTFLAIQTIISAVLFLWVTGQFQARLKFYAVGLILFTSAFAKLATVGTGLAIGQLRESLYWSYLSSYSIPLLMILAFLIFYPLQNPSTSKYSLKEIKVRLWATSLLAIAAAMIPQADILMGYEFLNPEQLGEFSRVSLFYKTIFFALFIFSQWLLPHQIQDGSSKQNLKSILLVLFVGVTLSIISAAAGPFVAELLLNFSIHQFRDWILLSCLNMSLLIAIYFDIQSNCSQLKLMKPTVTILLVGLAYLASYLARPTMTNHLAFMTGFNSLLFIGLHLSLKKQSWVRLGKK